MTDRPILFSGPMVRALLAGTKTQTRRVLSAPKWSTGLADMELCDDGIDAIARISGCFAKVNLGFAVGDRLYVREAWRSHAAYDDISPAAMGGDEAILYVADDAHQTWGYPAITKLGRFRQGMHMPRWASRLTLAVSEVRVQRLQDIGEEDAIAEGCAPLGSEFLIPGQYLYSDPSTPRTAISATSAYESLWNQINEARGYGWDANPWIVAVSFTVEHRNIDEARP
ncbi:hypothetical protein [Mesorhizobium sp.]|uniref:hypothetical protein n=1 Tax=Mesorhizobium sp. TaxID=1871066 RepID=UPI0011FAD33E|nr:hypothetical protein [Mesorhizobium sp.]TIM07558.1 MAG: hypothetical protein E5Y62_18500 [Mesorhizobium sp.]